MQLSPGSDAVQVPDEIGVDPGDIVLPAPPRPRPDDRHAARLDAAQPRRHDDRRRRRLGEHRHDEPRVRRREPRLPVRDATRRGRRRPADYADAVLANTLRLVATLTTTADVVRRRSASGSPRRAATRSRRPAPGSQRARHVRRRSLSTRGLRSLRRRDRPDAGRGELRPPRRGNRMHTERHAASVSPEPSRSRQSRAGRS